MRSSAIPTALLLALVFAFAGAADKPNILPIMSDDVLKKLSESSKGGAS